MTLPLTAALAVLPLLPAALQSGEASAEPGPDTWPQWRGPTRDGQLGGGDWPGALDSEHLRERWRVTGLGPSYSGPIVTPQRVYTTATEDKEREVVRAHDRATGELIWESSWPGAISVPFFAARNGSWIRSTPACDGEHLYVAGMLDVLVCLDADTGEIAWSADLAQRLGTDRPAFGFVCSPLVVDEHVYVQAGASFLKLDKRSGEVVWRSMADRGGMDSAFSSPVLTTIAGREQLLVQTRTDLAGVDPESGESLWSLPIPAFRGMNILTPLPTAQGVFTATYGGRSQLVSVQLGEQGFQVEQAWEGRGQGYMSSPVLIDGHVYLFMRSNRFGCLDAESGEARWTSPPTGDEYWSLVANRDRILALANTGSLRLLRADPGEYAVLSEREVSEQETWAHLAVAGQEVFVRSLGELIAFEWK